jgi:ABC-type dipeptide/oligopeptide/nickel transport system permease component
MINYIIRRILKGLITIWFIVTITFFGLRGLPGNPVEAWLGDYATSGLITQLKAEWDLDKPIHIQYFTFLRNITQGDFGRSFRMGENVGILIGRYYPYTVRLVLGGMALAVILAIPVGVIAAVKANSWTDISIMGIGFIFISMPAFWLGLLLLMVFSLELGWFPTIGSEEPGQFSTYLPFLTLPCLSVGLKGVAMISRMVRSSMLDVLGQDYVTVARSKGLAERTVRYKHALSNALTPVLSLIGLNLVILLGGTVITEVVFSRPGLGSLYVEAIINRDYPMIQGCLIVLSSAAVFINLVTDLAYGIIDPRIRYD